jgi:hypothetical protein
MDAIVALLTYVGPPANLGLLGAEESEATSLSNSAGITLRRKSILRLDAPRTAEVIATCVIAAVGFKMDPGAAALRVMG